MTRSKRMQPVANVVHNRQQNAARVMGERQRALDDQQQRLQELNNYRDEYARRFEDGGESMAGINMRDYRLFLSRLNEAIEEQARRVEQARAALEQSRGQWTATRVHSDAVNKVVERMQADERRDEDRREQKENDEFGQRPRGNSQD
ncbi:flagellar export protein FliJ [Thioalkalivibrio sulfidiphilus]|uniref:flagellar export protein FliJ n=1 Tax=Thioalkalivibrio sulfidiphilus TaxID=1033854 RepID=UPI003B331624